MGLISSITTTESPGPFRLEADGHAAALGKADLSADPEQEYFSDGVVDDIVTELSRDRSLFVIARNSSVAYRGRSIDVKQVGRQLGVRYVLEGSVRRIGDRVRIVAQLVDAQSGSHIWAERYDRAIEDVFTVQDQITFAVATSVLPAISEAELRRILRRPPGSLSALESYQRRLWHLWGSRSEEVPRAREFFCRALELDPMLAAAHTGLAVVFQIEGTWFAYRPLLEALRFSGDEAQKALELDPTDALAHVCRGHAVAHLGDYVGGFDHVERAISINPSCAWAYHLKAANLAYPIISRSAPLLSLAPDDIWNNPNS